MFMSWGSFSMEVASRDLILLYTICTLMISQKQFKPMSHNCRFITYKFFKRCHLGTMKKLQTHVTILEILFFGFLSTSKLLKGSFHASRREPHKLL